MINRPLIAIDIGSSSVKVVELAGGGKKKLKSMGLEVLPPQAVIDGDIREPEIIASTIRELMSKLKISPRGRRTSIAVGGGNVLIKRALLKEMAETEDFSEQVFYEAQQIFQHDMEDMFFKFLDLESPTVEPGRRAMLLVGAKSETVEQNLGLIKSIGLRAGVIDCNVLAISNMFDFNYPVADAMVALVNIGASSTQVVVSFNGEFLYTREFLLAGNEYTQRLAEALAIDFENAEALKVSASLGSQAVSPDMQRVMNEVNDAIVAEIQVTLNFYFQSEEVPPNVKGISYIFLSGGGARTLGLDAAIAANLQVPVQIINPFQRIDVKSSRYNLDYLLAQGPIYGQAVGLALRHFGDSEI